MLSLVRAIGDGDCRDETARAIIVINGAAKMNNGCGVWWGVRRERHGAIDARN